MALNFPNASRSCDARRRFVRFWAYDGSLEIPFFVEAAALAGLAPQATEDEHSMLRVFDQHWDRICMAAERVYARNSRGSYLLGEADLAR